MPAAVVRQEVGQWPVSIQLSDDNAMMASYKLSSLSKTRLVARISTDGDVMPSAGDIQGEVIMDMAADHVSPIQITINTEVTP